MKARSSITRICHHCENEYRPTKPGAQLLYCSSACYHADRKGIRPEALRKASDEQHRKSIERRTIPCPYCGTLFLKDNNPACVKHRYCSSGCKAADARRKVSEYLATGKPIIEVHADHIKCLLPGCGRTLRVASTHFSRTHGFDTSKTLSHTERQLLYGLRQGDRLACGEAIEEMRQRALNENSIAHARNSPTPGQMLERQRELREEVGVVPKSADQMFTILSIVGTELHGSQVKKQRAKRTAVCTNCGKEFDYVNSTRKGKRVFCSAECSSHWLGANQNLIITAEARKRAADGVRMTRATKKWSSRVGERWYRTLVCEYCGKEKTIIRSKKDRFCSPACGRFAMTSFCGTSPINEK